MKTKKWQFFATALIFFVVSAPANSFAGEWTGGPPVQPNSWRKRMENGTVCQIRWSSLTNSYEFNTGSGSSLSVYAFRDAIDGALRGSSLYGFEGFKEKCGLPLDLPKHLVKTP